MIKTNFYIYITILIVYYTPDIRSMWGYIVFAFPFRPFVRTYVPSLVCLSFRHRVKVFVLKFIRPHVLKTL